MINSYSNNNNNDDVNNNNINNNHESNNNDTNNKKNYKLKGPGIARGKKNLKNLKKKFECPQKISAFTNHPFDWPYATCI